MRKSSKAVSLLLSGLMATSCFSMAAVSASAATADSEGTGVMTAEERIAAGHQIVFFQFPDSAWGDNANVKYNKKKHTCNVFCSYYAIYGNTNEVKERSWEAPSTSMYKDSAESSLYYFDITESGQGEMEEGATYGILFSTKANAGQADLLQPNGDGYQTCDLYFDTTCLGDTFVIDTPVATRENTANSQKIDYKAHSKNGVSGSLKKVSSLCAYIDGMDPGNAPKSVELANRLQSYLPNPVNEPSFTWAKIEPLLPKLGTTSQEVYDMYVEKFADKLAEGVPYEPIGDGSDLKPDGTLKDVYRYRSITTTEIDEATGIAKEKVVKYPTLDLVRERLNLPAEQDVETITEAHVSLGDAVVAAGEEIPVAIVPAGAPYCVETGWETEDATFEDGKTYTLTAEFSANEGYEFSADATATLDNVGEGSVEYTQSTEIVDGKLVAKFTFEIGSASEDTFVVAGSEAEIFGTAWDAANMDNLMVGAGAVYAKEFTVDKAYTDVQLKVVKNGAEWIGDATGNNVTFNLTGAGTFTVTIDPETNEINVIGDIVEFVTDFVYDTVYAVGNGEGAWLNGAAWDPAYAANEMTQVADDVWEIEFADVPDGFERQVKFAIDGAWTHNFGGVFEESGVQSDAVYNGDNITFDTEEDTQTVKLQLDLSAFDFASKEGAKFTLTIETEPPVVEDTYVVAGSPAEVFGTAWDAGNEDNTMVGFWAGTEVWYEKEFTVDAAYTDVQLKVVKNSEEWIGDATGNNVTFNLTGPGTFTVKYYPETNEIVVEGDIVEFVTDFVYDTVFAVGNGEGAWLNGAAWDPAYAANEMTEVADDVWEIEFTDVPDGFERQVKFAIDGAWTHNFGGVFEESGVQSDAVYNGDNITFDTEEDTQTIKLQLDLSEFDFATKEGAKFTLTIEGGEPAELIGIIGDVNGDNEITVDDATLIQQRGIELIEFDEAAEMLADVNQDGRVSILDVTCVQKYLAEYLDKGTGYAGALLYDNGKIVPAN